jgi:putative CocE/NonD family hydrolase
VSSGSILDASASTFEVVVERDLAVPMRDGVALRADLYLPTREDSVLKEPRPAVLVRTSYNKSDPTSNIDPVYFAQRGFAVVIQDVRGRWASEGVYYHGINETADGDDTLTWIASQPWSNGKVGMTGISYLAAVQCAAALSGNPYLSSIFHVKAPFNYYENGNRMGGNAAMYMVPITLFFASTSREAQQDDVTAHALADAFAHGHQWLHRLPFKKGLNPLSATPGIEDWLIDMMEHEAYDEFWTGVKLWQPCEYLDEYADIPGMYVSGWYGMYREPDFAEALMTRKRGPIRLLMGPWTHLDFGRSAGDVDFGEEAALSLPDYYELQLRWFDETLRDGLSAEDPPVRIFVMGGGAGAKTTDGLMSHGGRWRFENEWPIARTEHVQAFVHPRSTLAFEAPGPDVAPTSYVHDPRTPVPTIGGVNYFLAPADPPARRAPFVPYGGHDQREQIGVFGCTSDLPIASRADVAVFDTAPLEHDVEVTGTAVVHLWFSSSAEDTDFVARLIDVYPPNPDYPSGYALNVSEGVTRARFRDSQTSPSPLTPGETYRLTIRLHPTSNLFKAGHRLRIQVASSDFPAYDVNPGNGGTTTAPKGPPIVAQNTIFHDSQRPSHVVLPVVP